MAEAKTTTKKPAITSLQERFRKAISERNGDKGMYELLQAHGINFDPVSEENVKQSTFWQHDGNVDHLIWIYESDLSIRWTNAEKPNDQLQAMIHTIGASDKGPATAKASAWDQSLSVYLASKFGFMPDEIIVYAEDYASRKPAQEPTQRPAEPRKGSKGINAQPSAQNRNSDAQNHGRVLTGPQIDRLHRKASAAGVTMQQIDQRIKDEYGLEDPHKLTRQQYDEICSRLDAAARSKQGGQLNE